VHEEVKEPAQQRSPLFTHVIAWVAHRTLSTQFLIASGLVILIATLSAGYLTTRLVSDKALNSKAGTTALLVQSLTEAEVQALALSKVLPAASIELLDSLFDDPDFKARFPHLEIWATDGTVAYSRAKPMIGQRFEFPDGLQRALKGEIVAIYADFKAAEHTFRNINTEYLEIYSPLHDQASGRIIGVAEIHEEPNSFMGELARLRIVTWATVALFSFVVMLGLFLIVRRGSRTIETQRHALSHRAEEAELASKELMELRDTARRASMELANMNETFIRRIGADLHDGPVQLMTLAILQLDELRDLTRKDERDRALDATNKALGEALIETRTVTKSLLLPEILHLWAKDVVAEAIKQHEARTRTKVAFTSSGTNADLPPALKTCIYRFVQEGLNNAYRHAGANGQRVRCRIDMPVVSISVEDDGLPPGTLPLAAREGGMGLYGLRQRIESFGGSLTIGKRPDGGMVLAMTLELQQADAAGH